MAKKKVADEVVGEEVKATEEVEFPKVVILVALDAEREKIVKPAMDRLGLLGRKDIWVVVTGVGKVSSAISATMLMSAINTLSPTKFKECLCINVGVCAGNALAMEKFPDAQINKVVNNDFKVGYVDGKLRKEIISLTVDTENPSICFTQDKLAGIDDIPDDKCNPFYVDMELFSIASACAQYGVRCVGLKSVCEVIGEDYFQQREGEVFDSACERSAGLLAKFLSTNTDVVLK